MASFVRNLYDCLVLVWILIMGIPGFIKFKLLDTQSTEDEESIEGKVVIVTGAQRGIGKAAATEFAKRGAMVVMGCVDVREGRQTTEEIKTLTGNNNIVVIPLDLSDMSSVREFAAIVRRKYPDIKILLNNAGLGGAPNGNVKTKDGFNLHMAVNHLGQFLLTNLLLPNLRRGSRVVSISSTLQLLSKLDLDDLMMDRADIQIAFENALPYTNTKFANALFIKELGRRLEGSGIHAYALCPGIVRTTIFQNSSVAVQFLVNVAGRFIGLSPEEACVGIMYCALDKRIAKESGLMYRFKQHFKTANDRLNSKSNLAEDLWELSSKLVNLEK